jgi:hypothetical protein
MMLNNVRSGATNGDDEAWNTRPSTDSWHPRGESNYRDNAPVPAQISPDEKGVDVGYGVGVTGASADSGIGTSKPSKQHSVDNVYLEHPSKATKEDVKADTTHGASYYDPPDAPPSYHGHDPMGNSGMYKESSLMRL